MFGYSIVWQRSNGTWMHVALFNDLGVAFDYWGGLAYRDARILDWDEGCLLDT
jgi:hypothetical protein